MFFWIGLVIILVVFAGLLTWGVRGYTGRFHEPGTQHLVDGPSRPREDPHDRRG